MKDRFPIDTLDYHYQSKDMDRIIKVVHYFERGRFIYMTVINNEIPIYAYSTLSEEHAWMMFKKALREALGGKDA